MFNAQKNGISQKPPFHLAMEAIAPQKNPPADPPGDWMHQRWAPVMGNP